MSYEKVEDTFFEAFEGQYVRVLITGPNKELVERAAYDSTSTPSAVIGRVEGGVEGFLPENETPDGRYGAVVQYWLGGDNVEKFAFELSYRIRQDILVKPFMSVFDYPYTKSDDYIEMMDIVGHCGDGYEWTIEKYGRNLINVPIAVPDFLIEEKLSLNNGTMGGNFWYLCETQEAVLEAGKKALDAIKSVEGAIAPFEICSAASKPETNYPEIGPSTNHFYCPSLKQRLGDESKVPKGVNYIPEIVINAVSEEAMNEAIKAGIDASMDVDGVIGISAGNYDGKLGDKNINLLDILK